MPGTVFARAYRGGFSTQGNTTLASSNAVELQPPGPVVMAPYSLTSLTAELKGVTVQRGTDGWAHVRGTLVIAYQGEGVGWGRS